MTTLNDIREALTEYKTLDKELDLTALDCTYEASGNTEIDLQELQEEAQQYISEFVSVICYSIELAQEMGFELQAINSELLASLLLQEECNDELSQLINELEA